MTVLFELLLLFVLFIIFFVIGMSILTSPILLLLYLDGTHRLRKLRYKLGLHEQLIKRSINQRHPFYLSLNEEQKREFIWRVFYFLNTTDFIIKFRGDNSKVKMTISFVAAQISYGLTIKCFDLYHRVIVYEDDYYSHINQRYHKGEVNPGAGIIVFSWKGIQEGLSRNNDGLNLLVHEFAHALRLEHLMMENDYTVFDEDAFTEMDNLSKVELEHIRITDDHLFRRYAATNIDEFFAVASENFFERAQLLKHHLPQLYNAYKKLYNQDPASAQYN